MMLNDLRGAFSLLTILPIPPGESSEPGRIFAWFPLVGVVIGGGVAAVAWIPGLEPGVAAFLTLAAWVILTGGLHLDGFGDACDGLLAAVPAERRLEIMKDSRSGIWAVAGLILLLLGKWSFLHGITPWLLILPPVLGRWGMVIAACGFPAARLTGSGAHFRRGLGHGQVAIATITMLIAAGVIGFFEPRSLLLLPATLAVVLIGGWWASARLGGGITGDVYGMLCELVEAGCLLVLNVVL